MNKNGFTMAEVVIALMIVGAMMVILFPIIRDNSPDQDKIMFRKAFNALSQAVSNMQFDDNNYPESATNPTSDTGQTVPRGFNNQPGTFTAGTKFCTLLADQLNTIGAVTCGSTVTCNTVASTGWGSFTTSDGVVWRTMEGAGTACNRTCTDSDCTVVFPLNRSNHAYQSKVFVDVDGPSRGPNCSTDSNAATLGLTRCSWYNTCTAGLPNPKGTTPDNYIIGVRFDGNLHLGSSDSGAETDICGSNILSDPTTNTQ